MSLLKSIDLNLARKLRDKEYRDAFFENWSADEVADQMRRLRKRRKMRQVDVAERSGIRHQSAISRIEQSDYSAWNFATLLRIGQALDARVRIVFEPAEEVISSYERTEKRAAASSSINAARKASDERVGANQYEGGSRNLSPPPKDRYKQPPSKELTIQGGGRLVG